MIQLMLRTLIDIVVKSSLFPNQKTINGFEHMIYKRVQDVTVMIMTVNGQICHDFRKKMTPFDNLILDICSAKVPLLHHKCFSL